jgi:hypothetical protein
MTKVLRLWMALTCLNAAACATLKSQVENDPTITQPSGEKVFISFRVGKDGKDGRDTILGKTVINDAAIWLRNKGYVLVDEIKKADSQIIFTVDSETKQVYVPGQTYSIPIYGNTGTTSTVKNSWGQTLGTVETQPSNPFAPTGYQTGYREGYNAQITDRWLFIYVWKQERGNVPEKISQGQVFPEKRDMKFFEDQQVMASAVNRLLSESVFGKSARAPSSVSSGDPGCWTRLGITFDQHEKLERGAKIKDFALGSQAEAAGLKVGDIIYSLGSRDVPDPRPVKFTEGIPVNVVANRGGKEFAVKVMPTMQCVEN